MCLLPLVALIVDSYVGSGLVGGSVLRQLEKWLIVLAVGVASCSGEAEAPASIASTAPTSISTTGASPTSTTASTTIAPPAGSTTATPPTSAPTTSETPRPPLVVANADGVTFWTNGTTEVLVDGPTRVAFRLGAGTVVYQPVTDANSPVMVLQPGDKPKQLAGTEGVIQRLWGVGEIGGDPVVIYERWPVPCGYESLPECIGPLLALNLEDGSERDLGAFSAPAYALGPAGIEDEIVLVYNSGAEIGEIGGFQLLDLEGNTLENPACRYAVDCDQPIKMLGALSPGGERLAYVLDRMKAGTEVEYEFVDRSYGVVDLGTGEPILSVELNVEGSVAWLDFDGEHGVVSVGHNVYLVDADGVVDPLNVDGVATFSR